MYKFLGLLFLFILSGCSNSEMKMVPGIVPNYAREEKIVKVLPANVIGAVEPIYILPMKSPFYARIDTGATTSSIDVEEFNDFERDGDRWVSFSLVNKNTGEKYTYEKPRVKGVRIKRIGEQERRPVVEMDVKMGGEKFKALFTLADREDFEYQALIGRNILSGRAIVDVSISNTLK